MHGRIRLISVLLAAFTFSLLLAPAAGAAGSVPVWGKPWPKGTMKIYDATPKQYRFAVDYAVKHYNQIAAKVKVVKVKKRKQANVVIKENKRLGSAGLAKVTYRGKGPGKGTIELNRANFGHKFHGAQTAVHEFGHAFGLHHPRNSVCAVMSYGFPRSCKWYKAARDFTSEKWLCGLIQPTELKRLQKLYGKRKNKVKSRWCKIPANEVAPTMASSFTLSDASWQSVTGIEGHSRLFIINFNFTPFSPASGELIRSYQLSLQEFEGRCADASAGAWGTAQTWSRGWGNDEFDDMIDPTNGRAATRITSFYAEGGTWCYRLVGESYTVFGKDPAPAYSANVEVVVPPDPTP